jgi:uncharacterized membrane protein
MPDGDDPRDIREELASLHRRLNVIEWRLGISQAPAEPPGRQAPSPVQASEAGQAGTPVLHVAPAAEGGGPTLETTIGAHWLNRIGIAAVLVGTAFFLKYAFENNWIGPAARVIIGAGAGAAILGWAEVFHARGHLLFAHTLDVIGTGILYLSIWAASQTYALLGNPTAFGAMTVVTIAVVSLGVRHRSEFLAGVALTGGFLTPVLLSTGVNHEVELFSYVALLDVAALVLLALFPWVRALAVAFFGTLFLYIGWDSSFYSREQLDRTIAFATLFFLLFGVVPLLRRWGDEKIASVVVLLLPFANAIVYFSQVSTMLSDQPKHLAWYAIVLAIFFFVVAAALHLRGLERDDLAAAHLAIALGFITLAIPLHFDRLWITIAWLAESAALLLIARRLRAAHQRVFDFLGGLALVLGVFRLFFVDHFNADRLLLNDRAAAYAMAIAVFAGIAYATRQTSVYKWKLSVFALNFLAITELTMELSNHFRAARPFARDFSWSALWMFYGAMLMTIGFRRRQPYLRWLALALIGITIAKVFLYDIRELERAYRILSFIGLGVLLLAISFAYQRKWLSVPEE